MFEQLFDSYRKSSESWLQMQQDTFKQMTQQQWTSTPSMTPGMPTDQNRAFQRRWAELTVEILNKQRDSMDWVYKSGAQIIEQTFLSSENKSPEDYRRLVEDLWRNLFEDFKKQSEAHFRDLQKWAEKSLDMVQNPQP